MTDRNRIESIVVAAGAWNKNAVKVVNKKGWRIFVTRSSVFQPSAPSKFMVSSGYYFGTLRYDV